MFDNIQKFKKTEQDFCNWAKLNNWAKIVNLAKLMIVGMNFSTEQKPGVSLECIFP